MSSDPAEPDAPQAPPAPGPTPAPDVPSIDFERALSARVVLFYEAVAATIGLNPTDLKCLDLVAGEEYVSPGRLADLSGLTTGAITGVLDRLEAAGMVHREVDPVDRRRFTVRLLPERQSELDGLYGPLHSQTADALAGYGSSERAAIVDFLRRRRDLLEVETDRLRSIARRGFLGNTFSTPLGGITRGALVFESGAARLTFSATPVPGAATRVVAEAGNSSLALTGGAARGNLCEAVFTGPLPEVSVSGGTLRVRYRFRGFLQRRSAEIALNRTIPWTIAIAGGLSELACEMGEMALDGFELKGGATDLRMVLPEPRGVVRLWIKGNATSAALDFPTGVGLGLDISGNVERLAFAGQRLTAVRGKSHLETAVYPGASNRYQALFKGNSSGLTVTV